MNDPYKTLGVPRDASTGDIKAAFRRLARANHPDKVGGDSAKMADINASHGLLSDPERKAIFDATGQLVQPPSLEQEANNALLQLFTQLLDANPGKMLVLAKSSILSSIGNTHAAISKIHSRTVALTARREAITTKDGVTNLVHGIIDQQIQGLVRNLEQVTKALAVMELVEKMLDSYESSEEELIQYSYLSGAAGTTVLFRAG